MEWITKNWYLIIVLACLFIVGVCVIKSWLNKPTNEQISNVKEWLLYAVTEAEKRLGGGTGQLKLRFVYDWAVERFKWVSLIPFEVFSEWVDEALEKMKAMLSVNEKVKSFIEEVQ